MTTSQSSLAVDDATAPQVRRDRESYAAGLIIIAVVPSLFWSGLLALVCWLAGWPLPLWKVATTAALIFGFMVCIWASFVMAGRRA
jgi:fatty acid desaturase